MIMFRQHTFRRQQKQRSQAENSNTVPAAEQQQQPIKCLRESSSFCDAAQQSSAKHCTERTEHHNHRCQLTRPSLLLLSLLLALSRHLLAPPVCQALIQVPNRHTVASIPGDLVLGILVPVHERPSPKQAQTRTCGSVREQYGIQRVEAAFRTIDSINSDPNILPNITLGIEIRDSCWHSPIALEQSIEFIRDAMAASEQTSPLGGGSANLRPQQSSSGSATPGGNDSQQQQQQLQQSPTSINQQLLMGNNSICAPLLKQQQQIQLATKKVKNLVGVVGPASSTDTVQVQNLLQLFNMPQVGYSATSRDLSNKNFFKYFLRVVPSDKLQAQVLIDLMLAHNWTYITVAYTEGSYGSSLMNAFRERAQEAGICFATLESMPPNADDAKFDELIDAIQKHPNARIVICMCEGRTVSRLFAGFKRKNINNEYLVVGSDGWSDRFDVVDRVEEIALGGISIRIHSAYVHDFDDYYFSLNPFTNQRNPWFAEFWETRFQCNLPEFPPGNASGAANNQISGGSNSAATNQQQQQQQSRPTNFIRPAGARIYNRTCTGKESLRQNHKQDAKMAFVQKSIITMALGLDSMQRSICAPKVGLCPEMLPINGSILLQHLMNVRFSFLDEEVSFDEQGDPPGKYEILNFRRRQKPASPPSKTEPPTSSADYSTASANNQEQQNGRKKADNYDSYGTLRVFRPPSESSLSSSSSMQLTDRQRRRTRQSYNQQRRRQNQPIPSAEQNKAMFHDSWSATSDFEYVQVGSWKSSDGLSLFGDIHWPIRSTLDTHHLAATLAASSQAGGGQATAAGVGGSPGTTNMINEQPGFDPDQQQHSANSDAAPATLLAAADQTNWSARGRDNFELTAPTRTNMIGVEEPIVVDETTVDYYSGGGGQNNLTTTLTRISGSAREAALTTTALMMTQVGGPPPKSVCSLPCAKGHAKKIQSDSVKCCWVCVPCRPREYLFNEFKCKACEKGWWPNAHQTGCDQIPIEHLDWQSMEALAAISIACFGLILTIATAFVFIKHNDTPVVKSTTRELSYMILFAMILCYVNTFFLIAKPTRGTCFVTRLLPGFSFAMMYGALVTKTNRIARILAGSKKKIITRRPYFMSATAQVTITWLIVLIECLIIIAVLVREPADKMLDYPSDDRVVLVCNTTTAGIIAPLGFDFFLIAMCTLYAFKTRNVPENFNEAKFIGFTMYTTLVIWIAFVAIYLSSDHKVITLCLCISFSALFALFLLFFPRCYIILLKPEKNNRSFFTTTKNVRCHIGYQTGASAAAAAAAAASAAAANQHSTSSNSNQDNNKMQPQPQQQVDYCWCGSPDCLLASANCNLDLAENNNPEESNEAKNVSDNYYRWRNNNSSIASRASKHNNSSSMSSTSANNDKQQQRRRTTSRVAPIPTDNNNNWPVQFDGHGGDHQIARQASNSTPPFVISTGKQSTNCLAPQQQIDGRPVTDENRTARQDSSGGLAPNLATPPTCMARQLLGSIWSAFARRSRRKESDKVTSIQQHLRAIRHAENLDRQTHFRRSQVQRLVQRFDSTPSKGQLAAGSSFSQKHHHQQQHHHHLFISQHPNQSVSLGSCNQFGQLYNQLADFSEQNCDWNKLAPRLKFELLTKGVEAERFLIVLSQLIGCEQFWRLTNILSKYCATTAARQQQLIVERSPKMDAGDDRDETSMGQMLPLLDLNYLADRHFALAWLRFFVQLAHKSIESMQSLPSNHHHHRTTAIANNKRIAQQAGATRAPVRVGSLTAPTTTPKADSLGVQRRRPSSGGLAPTRMDGDSRIGLVGGGDVYQLAATNQLDDGQQQTTSNLVAQSTTRPRSIESREEEAARGEENNNCKLSLSCEDGEEFDDPIKRALERITGKSLSSVEEARNHHHHDRQEKPNNKAVREQNWNGRSRPEEPKSKSSFKVQGEDNRGTSCKSADSSDGQSSGQDDDGDENRKQQQLGCAPVLHLAGLAGTSEATRKNHGRRQVDDKKKKKCHLCLDVNSAAATTKGQQLQNNDGTECDKMSGAERRSPWSSSHVCPVDADEASTGLEKQTDNWPTTVADYSTTTTTTKLRNGQQSSDEQRPPSSKHSSSGQSRANRREGETAVLSKEDDEVEKESRIGNSATGRDVVAAALNGQLMDNEQHKRQQRQSSGAPGIELLAGSISADAENANKSKQANGDDELAPNNVEQHNAASSNANCCSLKTSHNNNNKKSGCSSRPSCCCCCCSSIVESKVVDQSGADKSNLSEVGIADSTKQTATEQKRISRHQQHQNRNKHHHQHQHQQQHRHHTCRYTKSNLLPSSSSTSQLNGGDSRGCCCCWRCCSTAAAAEAKASATTGNSEAANTSSVCGHRPRATSASSAQQQQPQRPTCRHQHQQPHHHHRHHYHHRQQQQQQQRPSSSNSRLVATSRGNPTQG